ncbi:MAG: tetratricopeptide repeat protein [Burkholderiales bacterium]
MLNKLFGRRTASRRESLQEAARIAESTEDLQHAVALRRALTDVDPASAQAWQALGDTLRRAGQQGQAVAAYEKALALGAPRRPLHMAAGSLHLSLGQHAQAIDHFGRILAEDSDDVDVLCMQGAAFNDLRRHSEAASYFERALLLQPAHSQSHFNLGLAHFERGDLDAASASFAHCAALRRGEPWTGDLAAQLALEHGPRFEPKDMAVNEVKLQHDCEQLEYLLSREKLPTAYRDVLADYRALHAEVRGRVDAHSLEAFDPARHPLVARTYKRPLFIGNDLQPDESLIDAGLDGRAIEDRYLAAQPNLVVCDGLLTPAAMQSVRDFCRESTFWNNIKPGYLGSYFFDGFCSKLLLRLAWELRERFPRIIQGKPLQMMWGYKCDSALPGLGVHADEAAVNVNFWITEDEANLDTEHGGLLVYTHNAPRDWDFAKFNNDSKAILDFLNSVGSLPLRVPYRANRAVIFDSDLFHATDQPRFRDGYLNRRINITLLYGLRSA